MDYILRTKPKMEGRNFFNFLVSAPGKVILFGEHSVVYKKSAVCMSIDRSLNVFLHSIPENIVSVNFPQINTSFSCSLEQFVNAMKEKCPLQVLGETVPIDKPELIDFNNYVESLKTSLEHLGINSTDIQGKPMAAILGFLFVMRGMCQHLSTKITPFSLGVLSNIEVGAGIGSSAAFAVAISGAVLRLRKHLEINMDTCFPLHHQDDNVVVESFPQNSGFSIDEAKVINKWAFCIEKLMHGQPSGIDNTTCTFGSVVVTSQQSNTGQLIFNQIKTNPRIRFLLISTGVSRNTADLVNKVRLLRDNNCAAVDAILNAMDVVAKEAFKTLEMLGANSVERQSLSTLGTNHNELGQSTADLYKTLSGLMELNHGLLRTLGVSHETLEQIVKITSSHGLSTKLTGAGGGGYAITLLPPTFTKSQLEILKEDLESNFQVSEIEIAKGGVKLSQ